MTVTPDNGVFGHHLNELTHEVLAAEAEFQAARAPFVYVHDPISIAQFKDLWLTVCHRACTDFLRSAVLGPGTRVSYNQDWVHTSQVVAGSACIRGHRVLMEALRLSITMEQLHIPNLNCLGHLIRWEVQKVVAGSRTPQQPSSSESALLPGPVPESDAASSRKATAWTKERYWDRAEIQKLQRLYAKGCWQLPNQGKGRGKDRKGKKGDGRPPGGEPAESK